MSCASRETPSRGGEIRPDIDDGIDRKVLGQLRARFLRVNQGRLQRARQMLSGRQRLVLRLLPLLFHVNHPLLPGYVSATTPAGLSVFEPDAELLAEAQRLTRSFSYRPQRGAEARAARPIHGLFLMGSLGTLAQSGQSDIDLWVCHAPHLSAAGLAELRRKCDLLEAWAEAQGAELHCFLVDPQRFGNGQRLARLSSEDCGNTQHYLLLDEFYRTAIWLGGRTPLWWLVPVYEERRYAEYTRLLLERRHVRDEEVLDLGHLARIPPGEFLGAGLWQLAKGIESPYKAALKLLLTEVYASEYPQVECLALRFKSAIFRNQLDLDELDPYVMLYRRLEEYLGERGESERLELIRRCLYLKIGKKLATPPRNPVRSWQRQLLERLTAEWHWSTRQLRHLDQRGQWKVRQVGDERRRLVDELKHSYHFLSLFARSQQIASSLARRDLALLGRRLYAAFERRPGKVETINPGIAPDLSEDNLTLVQQAHPEGGWALFSGSLNALEWQDFAPLQRRHGLIEVLAWAQHNGVLDSGSHLTLHPGDSDLTEFELDNLVASLRQVFPSLTSSLAEQALQQAARPTEALWLVNVGIDPLRQHSQSNIHMTSERTDALCYSGIHENLVLSLDRVTRNSWNELLVKRYDGPQALLEGLCEYLAERPGEQLRLQVRCFCRNRAAAIAERVEALFGDCLEHFRDEQDARYLLRVGLHYHLLEQRDGQWRHESLEDQAALLERLAEPRPRFSPLRLEAQALAGDELALILAEGRPGRLQVIYRLVDERHAELSVLDERNTLWRRRLPWHDEASLLAPLRDFLRAVWHRRGSPPPEIAYFQLLPAAPARALRLEPRPAPTSAPAAHAVRAVIASGPRQRLRITLHYAQCEFSDREHGTALFRALARRILESHPGDQRLPCRISDLDLSAMPGGRQAQSVQYLRYQSRLEDALNTALQAE